MSKPIPTIQKFMTPVPHTVGAEQSLAHAQTLLRGRGIRHLPVLQGGELVGVLSSRDVALVESIKGADARDLKVEDAMTTDVYTVAPDTALDQVAAAMAEHKYGSALVVQNGHCVGIFTTVDACRALAELLATRLTR